MIKSIVFDWGGVLIENPSSKITDYCAKSLQISKKDFLQMYKKYIWDFQKGMITEKIFWKNICSELNIHTPTIKSLWGTAFQHAYREKKANMLLASTLKKKGYCIGLLSNTEIPAMRFFQKQHYKIFDIVVFSCAERTIKPEKQIYHILLQRLHVEPEEIIFIDDNKEFIHGAEYLSINTIHFKNHHQLRKDLVSFLS